MSDLRFGTAAALYYNARNEKQHGQLDLLDFWFPGLIVAEIKPEGGRMPDAVYADTEFVIKAAKRRDRFYIGNGNRVTQILGRLIGTARGNKEKERHTAFLIQKHLAGLFVENLEIISDLKELVTQRVSELPDASHERFYVSVFEYIEALLDEREGKDEYMLLNELFPMDREVFEQILYNTVYQLERCTDESIANAFLWLLLGGLLRNEAGRVTRMFDSSFIPIYRQMSEDGTIKDKLMFLMRPDLYEEVYEGDDLEKRFPGIEWYCDGCGAHLNEQEGFNDQAAVWKCAGCGYENRLDYSEIFSNEEDCRNRIREARKEGFEKAVAD